jgi:hypothetical protein
MIESCLIHVHTKASVRSAAYHGGSGSAQDQNMWDFWLKMWHWVKFLSSTPVPPINLHSSNYITFINII